MSTSAAFADCSEARLDIRNNGAVLRFGVEIADDPQERAAGLMHRTGLPRFAGMLFIFERPQKTGFWMKNTLIPLDMVFIDKTGTVKSIHDNAVPGDLTLIEGGRDTFAVLEINGGLAKKLRLTPGAEVRHRAFAEGPPAWDCDD